MLVLCTFFLDCNKRLLSLLPFSNCVKLPQEWVILSSDIFFTLELLYGLLAKKSTKYTLIHNESKAWSRNSQPLRLFFNTNSLNYDRFKQHM